MSLYLGRLHGVGGFLGIAGDVGHEKGKNKDLRPIADLLRDP